MTSEKSEVVYCIEQEQFEQEILTSLSSKKAQWSSGSPNALQKLQMNSRCSTENLESADVVQVSGL